MQVRQLVSDEHVLHVAGQLVQLGELGNVEVGQIILQVPR